jgi:putative ABC transport system permease protein
MFVLLDSVRSALIAIRAHRLRSFLTSLGVVIGVAAVIAVVSLLQGMSNMIGKRFEGAGADALIVSARNDLAELQRGKLTSLTFQDVEQLRAQVSAIRDVCPLFSLPAAQVRTASARGFAQVVATTPNYQEVHQRFPRMGRFLSEPDERHARRVAVIGAKLIETLHLPANPIGHFIAFGGEWFKVIGVVEKRGDILGMQQDDQFIIPYKTGRSIIGNNRQSDLRIHLSLREGAQRTDATARIAKAMRSAHRLAPQDKDDFQVVASDQMAKHFSRISNSVTLATAGIVGVALLVGGVGIMNIMLVSVTERTREIGICKAIGARSRDIMLQFLVEAVLLSVGGGALGLAIGFGLGAALGALIPNFPGAYVPWWASLLALLLSAAVGIVFGSVPAKKAARLTPVEALRYE